MRWSLVALLDGLALWLFAVLFTAYQIDQASEISVSTIIAVVLEGWMSTPGLSIVEATGYLGLGLAIIGPLVIIVLFPRLGTIDEEERTEPSTEPTESAPPVSVDRDLRADGAPFNDERFAQPAGLIDPRSESNPDGLASNQQDPIDVPSVDIGQHFNPNNADQQAGDMNPFKSDPDPPSGADSPEEAETESDRTEDPGPTAEDVQALVERTDGDSVVVDADAADDYLNIEDAVSIDDPDVADQDDGPIGVRDHLKKTNDRLNTIREGMSVVRESGPKSDTVLERIADENATRNGYDHLRTDLETAEKTVQDFRISLGKVKPSYPSFIATDMNRSIDESRSIERSLEDITGR